MDAEIFEEETYKVILKKKVDNPIERINNYFKDFVGFEIVETEEIEENIFQTKVLVKRLQ